MRVLFLIKNYELRIKNYPVVCVCVGANCVRLLWGFDVACGGVVGVIHE